MPSALLLLAISIAAAGEDPTLPVCSRDWKVEVVAEAPRIVHPSTVACAPDGRVFVAEDPMDISAPSADLPLGRILCLHPDGRLTVFAEKLHAVFGLQWIEGRLFVLHNPRFSVFHDDDGVGKDRLDLIESTNPVPWALDWNDHIPAGFRLAMDGFLYVAVGDKGVYGAVGRDGKRVDLFGGGILRLRPDGTALEVFSTGVRNILDVALDPEDEVFTYDNTDERDWWSRLAHMVDGGDHGYPYDFKPRAPWVLPPLADYGGGAATGALAYLDDALPPEYHGNLFLADFGRRQVMRLRIERAGATFRVASREEDLLSGPPQFRPVGIAIAPDGLSLYVCDWNHPDTKDAQARAGRLLRVSYTGPSRAAPRPRWHLPASMGKPFQASVDELLAGLRHPAMSVRLTAQRRLADRGGDAQEPLARLLADHAAPTAARRHAIWAIDAIERASDGTPATGQAAILSALRDPDPSLRAQAARQLGGRRARAAIPLLTELLRDPRADVRFQAATALGRIGGPASVRPLLDALDEDDLFARHAAVTALRRIAAADRAAYPGVARGLESAQARVREGTLLALRETFDGEVVRVLHDFAGGDHPAAARSSALETIAGLHRRPPPWKGEWWGYHPVDRPRPRKSLEWEGTARVLDALRRGLLDRDPPVRRAAVEGLALAGEEGAGSILRERFEKEPHPEVRRAILGALGRRKDSGVLELARRIIEDRSAGAEMLLAALEAMEGLETTSGETAGALVALLEQPGLPLPVLLRAIETLGRLGSTSAAPVMEKGLEKLLVHAAPAIRRAALEARALISGPESRPQAAAAISPLLRDPDLEVRRAAALSLGRLGERSAAPRLIEAFSDDSIRFETASALARTPDRHAIDAYLFGLSSPSSALREACRSALREVAAEALPLLEARWPAIIASPRAAAEVQRVLRAVPAARESAILRSVVPSPGDAEYLKAALEGRGDPARGKSLFLDPRGVGCVRCHRVSAAPEGTAGGDLGPDLSSIGLQQGRQALAESILDPSRVVRDGYRQEVVVTRQGDLIAGAVRGESPEELLLQDPDGAVHRIPRSRIRERRASDLSLMPEGLEEGLTPEEFADLVAFLESLKGRGG